MINAKKAHIEYLKDMQDIFGMSYFKDETENDTEDTDDIDNTDNTDNIDNIDDIEQLKKDIARLYFLQKEIQSVIELVEDDDCRLILFERYVLLKKWKDISEDTHYSEKHPYKIHRKALNILSNINELNELLQNLQQLNQ